MAIQQGFRNIDGALYIHQENTDTASISVAMGMDVATSIWTLNVISGAGAKPGSGYQPIAVDPATGNLTLSSDGSGAVIISGNFSLPGDLTVPGNILLPTTSSTVGQIRVNNIPFIHAFGTRNTFIGEPSGNFTLTTGSSEANTGVGSNTLLQLTTGQANVGVGDFTLNIVTTGSFNTGVGQDVFETLLTGSFNVGIGIGSGGSYVTSESSNILINSLGVVGDSNTLRIGRASGSGNGELGKSFIHGIRGVTTGNADAIAVLIDSAGQLGTVSSSIRFKENIEDMGDDSSAILNLRPVTFTYKTKPDKKQYGLIAEEVLSVMPDLVVYNQDGDVESVKYHDLPALLLNELKKANDRISALEQRLNNR